MGRKYGRLKYGAYTYDKGGTSWIPIPVTPGGIEIWNPLPTIWPPPPDRWAVSFSPPTSEIWNSLPVIWPPPPDRWGSATTPQAEIWVPINPPL